ncbi:DoxX family protein [Streptomyces viridochromogenes]|uniref:DoxX family protein n=1 Tax=Streptomyces viridochromogenes TaxID=1938 RepID=UPI0006A00172|nr:DoxX family protein [Streptomyces viridochromogenes]KOG07526.1 DoxX family protein [Streptomyces viridochromogenes]KOG12667.1 DoxX family protein [Streptomyces viridochromogenes]
MSDASDAALLAVRLLVGVVMVAHGWNHWRGGGGIKGTAGWFAGLGLTRPRLQAWLSVVTEIGAGVLLVLGLLTSLACAAVLSVMLVAGLLAHRTHGFFVFKEGYEYVLVLGVLAVAFGAWGPGEYAVDTAAGLEVTGWAGAGVVLGVGVVATAGLLAVFWRPRRTT